MGKGTAFVMGALAGAFAGVCVGVMLAPRSGIDTRFLMARKTGSFASDVEDFASGALNNVKGTTDSSSDELREKIEAARQRIAAQASETSA